MELEEALGMFDGAIVNAVGRAADLGIFEFTSETGNVALFLHIQCPFRVLHDGDMMIGSDDMNFPQKRLDGKDSDEPRGSIFDERSKILNRILARLRSKVDSFTMMDQGLLVLRFGPSIILQVFPDCSGRVEMWRFFAAGGEHYGFPRNLFSADA
ncbi:hypothetical protein [Streptomyces beijiangensis]|uniref:Uncharacterized protein n=1 Tax=Streptomyces beijiangensis TaxID=163361 RepID=A0A939F776_9ACTN|nr:hypothetical protein [Streptomyces beijiangensis]MBO0513831.1 hypothetical protein [Streptomyces beijiangensis]